MPHIFDPSESHKLDSAERRRTFPSQRVIQAINEIEEIGRTLAFDIGAGTGYLTIPLSRIFERVYAIEISPEMAETLKQRLREEGIGNVNLLICHQPPDVDLNIDLVVFSCVLHEMEDPEAYLRWARRASHIVVCEWKKIDTPHGPPLEERISEEDLLRIARCFDVVTLDKSLPYHYIAIMRSTQPQCEAKTPTSP